MATIREMCLRYDPDTEPIDCGLAIVYPIAAAVLGATPTAEHCLAYLHNTGRIENAKSGDGIRAWLDDLGAAADVTIPDWVVDLCAGEVDPRG